MLLVSIVNEGSIINFFWQTQGRAEQCQSCYFQGRDCQCSSSGHCPAIHNLVQSAAEWMMLSAGHVIMSVMQTLGLVFLLQLADCWDLSENQVESQTPAHSLDGACAGCDHWAWSHPK